ncbi:MAG TPA: ABC transporter permease [Streptosporangiaceae bacterium]
MRPALRLVVASTKMFLRSPDVLLAAVLLPGVYVALIQLLRRLDFVVHAVTIGAAGFMAVGVATGLVAFVNEHTAVAAAATYKATGTLQRIAVTPLRPATFIAAHAIPRVAAALVESVVVLVVVRALGIHLHLGLGLLAALPLVLLMTLIALSLGFAIAGHARTAQGANQLDTFLGGPVFLLSGAFFPITGFPDWLRQAAEYAIPYTAPMEAIRGILSQGQSLDHFPRQLAVGVVWLVLAAALAARTYRFTET